MQNLITRFLSEKIQNKIENIPVTAILGPRQCGKSTLAKTLISNFPDAVYLDLERASDINKLQDAEAFFEVNANRLICLDEVQRAPELFPAIRAAVDVSGKNGQFLVLGSASPELLKQSSESLAGRISYQELTPFLYQEGDEKNRIDNLRELWLRGGFPRSFLASDISESYEWRQDFIRTFLERDIPQLGFNIPSGRLDRFWRMCAHVQGQLLNSSKLGESLGVSHHTARSYLDILVQTYVLRVLPPYEANLKKRLVKSPKAYIRDTGLFHALLGIETQNDLLGHPSYGASWESFVIENILAHFQGWQAYFYRTSSGSEIDLVLERGARRIAVECKVSTSPSVNRGFRNALDDLDVTEAWVIAPVKEAYPIDKRISVVPLDDIITMP